MNRDGGELEADVKHERPEEDVPLWILENRIEKSTREDAEGADVARDARRREAREDVVIDPRGQVALFATGT